MLGMMVMTAVLRTVTLCYKKNLFTNVKLIENMIFMKTFFDFDRINWGRQKMINNKDIMANNMSTLHFFHFKAIKIHPIKEYNKKMM